MYRCGFLCVSVAFSPNPRREEGDKMPIPQIETASGARCVSSAAISFGVSYFESRSQAKMRSKNSYVFSRFAAAAAVCRCRRRVVTASLRDVNKSFVACLQ